MRKILVALLVMVPIAALATAGPVTLVNEQGLSYNNTYPQNTNAYGTPNGVVKNISAQITFSSATVSSTTFTDGSASTASITVVTNNLLATPATNQITLPSTNQILGTPATNQFTVVASSGLGNGASGSLTVITNTGITGTVLSIYNGPTLIRNVTNGFDWQTGVTSSNTATNIAAALNAVSSVTGIVANSPVASSIVYTTATAMGTGTNSFVILSSTLTAVSSTTFSGAVNPATISVNGNVLTNGNQWTSQATSSATALSIANAINSFINGVQASTTGVAGGVVYTTATASGTPGNAFTAATSAPTYITVASTTFSGGTNRQLFNDSINFNGTVGQNGIAWTDASNTSSGTAASIAAWLSGFGVIAATATSGNPAVIYATATVAGDAGNAFTLSDTDAVLSEASPTFLGGQNARAVIINGFLFTAGVQFATGTVNTTATNLAASINTTTGIGVAAQALANVITTTATTVGLASNYVLATSSQPALKLSAPVSSATGAATGVMTGGTNAGFTLNSAVITAVNAFPKAFPVLYTATKALAPLATGTTYFVIPLTPTTLELALTSTGAVAGLPIVITSSSTQTTADTYGLIPETYTQGAASGKWQVSNDGVNYVDFLTTAGNVAVSSQTFTVSGSSTVAQDFGTVDYGYIQYKVLGPTAGGIALKVILNGKD